MLNLIELQPGQRLRLNDGRQGDVTENIGDGIWVAVTLLDADGQPAGEPELVHCEEIAGLAPG